MGNQTRKQSALSRKGIRIFLLILIVEPDCPVNNYEQFHLVISALTVTLASNKIEKKATHAVLEHYLLLFESCIYTIYWNL